MGSGYNDGSAEEKQELRGPAEVFEAVGRLQLRGAVRFRRDEGQRSTWNQWGRSLEVLGGSGWMTVPGATRWVEFSEVVEVEEVNTSAYGDDGVHSREAAETRGEERRGGGL